MSKSSSNKISRALKALIIVTAVCLWPLFVFGGAEAQASIGVAPGSVTIGNAVRGTQYSRLITFFNDGDSELTFNIVRDGDAANWATLHPASDPKTTADKIDVAASGRTQFLLEIAVPSDAADGVATGTISFQSTVSDSQSAQGQGRANVSAGVGVSLSVTVGGTQTLSGSVLDAYADDVEVGSPAVIETTFNNTGNVLAQPDIKAAIRDDSGNSVGEASPLDSSVDPGQTMTIGSNWDTGKASTGAYVATVTVNLDGNQIFSQDVSFNVVPVGALKQGVLQKLSLENSPQAGGSADLTADFQNKTHQDMTASFVANIYRDGKLLDAQTTDPQPVPAGQTITVKASLNVPDNGKYMIRGKVTYSGKETDTKEIDFSVGDGGGLPVLPLAVGGVAIVGVAGAGFAAWRLRRRSPSPRSVGLRGA